MYLRNGGINLGYYTVQKIQKTIIQMCRNFHWAKKFRNSDLHDMCAKVRSCYTKV